jgi:hypothetical protein
MEVHHHSHKPKNWKEYITEFIMLFLAVSMGFIAENIREKHIENERSEELMHAFITDVKENQKHLDSLIENNKRMSSYYEGLTFKHGFGKEPIDLIELSETIDLWMYRFVNKKTIFEQMKSTGALRYIQDKKILEAILKYEESADLVEIRSMENETNHYITEFRPALAKILPLSFFKYKDDEYLERVTKVDTLFHPGRYENYKLYASEIKKELENTKLTTEQIKTLGKTWYAREEKIWVGLRFQMELRDQGDALLKLIEPKYQH